MGHPHFSTDTIVAIATPLGEGGLGVVRLSGPLSISLAEKIFKSKTPLTQASTHTLHHGTIISNSGNLDEAVASIFKSPASYTGENIVEFSCHGSPVILQSVVELCLSQGARMAKPGEFTERAYLNGKMDLTQAEAVADLIRSRSDRARRAATAQLEGRLNRFIQEIRLPLINLLAQLEANLDFVEEDIPPLSKISMKQQFSDLSQSLQNLISTSLRGRVLRKGLRVALTGRPNVGKSSLFNALLAQDRAIVTEVPGTTRDTLEESFQWAGFPVVLIDTAGLRDSQDPIEKLGHERTHQSLKNSDIQILILDGSESLTKNDLDLLAERNSQTTIVAINKSDCSPAWKPSDVPALNSFTCVSTSAKKRTGLEQLSIQALAKIQMDGKETEESSVVVNDRHAVLLESALLKIKKAALALQENRSEESIGLDLKDALRFMDQVTGTDVNDDVLAAIFNTFCIGK